MIARIWKGAVRTSDGDAYADYIHRTGVAGYTPRRGIEACGCCDATSPTGPSL